MNASADINSASDIGLIASMNSALNENSTAGAMSSKNLMADTIGSKHTSSETFLVKGLIKIRASTPFSYVKLAMLNLIVAVLIRQAVNWYMMTCFESENPCFRYRNGHNSKDPIRLIIAPYALFVWITIACLILGGVMGLPGPFVYAFFLQVASVAFQIILLSSLYLEAYFTVILKWRAEAEPSQRSTILVTPDFFYSRLCECISIGVWANILTGNFHILMLLLFLSTLIGAVYDAASSFGSIPDFSYRGFLLCFIAVFGQYLYSYESLDRLELMLYCNLMLAIKLLITLTRFKVYSNAAKNDMSSVNPVSSLYAAVS